LAAAAAVAEAVLCLDEDPSERHLGISAVIGFLIAGFRWLGEPLRVGVRAQLQRVEPSWFRQFAVAVISQD
jgi:hypothetical protein